MAPTALNTVLLLKISARIENVSVCFLLSLILQLHSLGTEPAMNPIDAVPFYTTASRIEDKSVCFFLSLYLQLHSLCTKPTIDYMDVVPSKNRRS
jgi:hypothetical protein